MISQGELFALCLLALFHFELWFIDFYDDGKQEIGLSRLSID